MVRNSKRRKSPEEEEEPLETEADRANRTALPNSVRRNLLQASPSRRSRGSRTATLTPTPNEIIHHRKPSLLAPRGRGRPRKLRPADESQATAVDTTPLAEVVTSQAAAPRPQPRTARGSLSTTPINTQEGSDDDQPEITTQRNAEAGPSKSAHGPHAQVQETINIASDSDQLDQQSLFSSSSSIQPRVPRRKQKIRKCKGAPFVELPYLSLSHIKSFTLPPGLRGPTTFSRNNQINYRQSPPPSPHSSSEDSAATWKISRQPRSGLFPRWATMPKDDSSDDLGGYGVEETEDELEEEDESSDGIEITRRTTRSKGKGKEIEYKRTTRAEAAVSPRRV